MGLVAPSLRLDGMSRGRGAYRRFAQSYRRKVVVAPKPQEEQTRFWRWNEWRPQRRQRK
jgi:hypothetical protein